MKKKNCQRLLVLAALMLTALSGCKTLKNHHNKISTSESSASAVPEATIQEPEPTLEEPEYIDKEMQEWLFGEWEVSKLIGFTRIQNNYTNYPDGHDIIGNRIIINEKKFSSEGIHKYKRYRCEVLNPTYSLSYMYSKEEVLISPIDSIKEGSEIDGMIRNASFQDLDIENNVGSYALVELLISSDKHFILGLDGAFYLLDKVQ